MGARIRAHDWSACGFGPLEQWSCELQLIVGMCLSSELPAAIYWGPEWRLIYNDACSTLIPAARQPSTLGRPAQEVWPDAWRVIELELRQVVATGKGLAKSDQPLSIERDGKRHETFWTYSLTPVREHDGSIAGVFLQSYEVAERSFKRREREAQLERLYDMFQQAPGSAAVLKGPNHVYEFANDAYLELIGGRPVVGLSVAEALPELVEQGFAAILDRVYRTGEPYIGRGVPVSLQRRPNAPRETRCLDFVYQPIRDSAGRVTGIFVQGADMTDRVQAEAALRQSEERLSHALSAGGGVGTWDWDVRSGIITADERFARLYGVDPERARRGASLEEFLTRVHREDLPRLRRALDEALIGCEDYAQEYRLVTDDGRIRWVIARGRCSRDASGAPARFPGVSFDITERKLVEQTLERAMQNREFGLSLAHRQREIVDPDAIMQTTARALGERLQADRVGFYRVNGDRIEMRACWTSGALPPMSGEFPAANLGAVFDSAVRADKTVALDDCGGRDCTPRQSSPMESVVALLVVPLARSGRPDAGLCVHYARARHWDHEDITLVEETAESAWGAIERARAELALRDSEERFRAIANSVDQMIWVTRPDGYHEYYNERWYEYTGVPEGSTDGVGWNNVFHPDDQQRAWAVWRHSLTTGEPYHIEYRLRHRSGHYRWVLGRAQPVRDREGRIVRWFGTCTDIQDIVDAREVLARSREDLEREVQNRTQELMKTEEQLRQAQKMEAIGQLTGGIAHDFNNMLAVVMGGLSLLQRRLARGDTDVGKYIDGVTEGVNRAAALTQRLLAFARQQPLAPEPLDPHRMVTGMTELLGRLLGDNICIETTHTTGLWNVKADPNQLENAILNLAVNARDAMPNGGRLRIDASNVHVNEREAREFSISRGEYVLIAVSDTGTGMTRDVMQKAFEPFFTTKAVGKGTGLGLSQVFGFVRQSGGHVAIDSELGVGTTVKIYLPRYQGAADEASAHESSGHLETGRADEVVLVVEDEPRVRGFSVEALRELGYTAIAAEGPREALHMIDAGQRIDLLFTDVLMPEISGRALADAVKERVPDVKVLFTTGYTRNEVSQDELGESGANLLPKPFGIEQLAGKVRSVLDARH